jgi:hypothetical protein
MKYVDYKATIWGRMTFSDDADMNKVIEKLNSGHLPAELSDDAELKFETFHFLDDTEEYITPEENNGCHTIEVYDDDYKMIWDNVNHYNKEKQSS